MDTRTINVSSRKYKEVVESSHLRSPQSKSIICLCVRPLSFAHLLSACWLYTELHKTWHNLLWKAANVISIVFCSAYEPPRSIVKTVSSVNAHEREFFFFFGDTSPIFSRAVRLKLVHALHTRYIATACGVYSLHLRSLASPSLRDCDSTSPFPFYSRLLPLSVCVGMLGLICSLFTCMQS